MNAYEGEFVTYYGKANEWRLYRLSDGTIVGYKSQRKLVKKGDSVDDDEYENVNIERLVTNTTDADKFGDFVDKHTPKPKRYNPYKDAAQTRIEIPE